MYNFLKNRIAKGYHTITKIGGVWLTNFQPMLHFFTQWKNQKTFSFLMSSEGLEVEHCLEMG